MRHVPPLSALLVFLCLAASASAYHRDPVTADFGAVALNLAEGPDGLVWFTNYERNTLGKLDAAGNPVTYTLPAGTNPEPIIAGPDGALWFVDSGGGGAGGFSRQSRVWRVTTDGTTSSFDLPGSPNSRAYDITVGPDGALWFTLFADTIGRITTDGTYTNFPLPAGAAPRAIATGPDGAVWFTGFQNQAIGRITTAGVVSQFPLPAGFPTSIPGDSNGGVVAGPDGNVYFTTGGDAFGRVTPAGEITQIPLDREQVFPEELVIGPDGALWVATTGGLVGRRTFDGTELGFYGSYSGPLGFISGPQDALWFAQPGIGITRLTPPLNPAHPVLSDFKLAPKKFRSEKRVKISYTLSAATKVRFTLVGKGGKIEKNGNAGANSFIFRGIFAGKKLAARKFTMAAQAIDGEGDTSEKLRVKFEITKPKKKKN